MYTHFKRKWCILHIQGYLDDFGWAPQNASLSETGNTFNMPIFLNKIVGTL